jgi:hypothetical protein
MCYFGLKSVVAIFGQHTNEEDEEAVDSEFEDQVQSDLLDSQAQSSQELDSEFQIEETEGLDQVESEIRQVSTALNGIVFDNQVMSLNSILILKTPDYFECHCLVVSKIIIGPQIGNV